MKNKRAVLGLPLFYLLSVLLISQTSFATWEINRSLKGDRLDRIEKVQPLEKPAPIQSIFEQKDLRQDRSKTQAVATLDDCPDCQKPSPERVNARDIEKVVEFVNAPRIKPQEPNMCVAKKLINAAKVIHRSVYRGRRNGGGLCGVAVRRALAHAGFYKGGAMGDAKDMMPGIRRMGFKNIIKPGMTPLNAPNGSILVYGAPKNKKGCRGLGRIYGHIEIKENNNSFLYDGNPSRNIQAMFGARCRPLIGVMVMGEDCPTCKPALKRACEI